MKKAINGEDIVLKSAGKQRFSYCYVADAVSGLLKIILDGVCGEAYNVADDDEGYTLGDYAKLIADFANKKVVFDLSEIQKGASVAVYALQNCDKLKNMGWEPQFTVSKALRKTYNILKELA